MSQPQDYDSEDEAAEIEDDLKILNAMTKDQDFNVWSDFRSSVAVQQRGSGGRDSLQALISRSSQVSTRASGRMSVSRSGHSGHSRQGSMESLEESFGKSDVSNLSTNPVVVGVPSNHQKFMLSKNSILEKENEDGEDGDIGGSKVTTNEDEVDGSSHGSSHGSEYGRGRETLEVYFSTLTPGERRKFVLYIDCNTWIKICLCAGFSIIHILV